MSTQTAVKGRVARVIGPVVDIEFPADAMPAIYNALTVEVTLGGAKRTLTLEVAQHLGDNLVRAISMQPTDGLVRGAEVRDSGDSITVPVGDVTKSHVWNTLGKPLDVEESSLQIKERSRFRKARRCACCRHPTTPTPRPSCRASPRSTARSECACASAAKCRARPILHRAVCSTRAAPEWQAVALSTCARALNQTSSRPNLGTSCAATFRSRSCAKFKPSRAFSPLG